MAKRPRPRPSGANAAGADGTGSLAAAVMAGSVSVLLDRSSLASRERADHLSLITLRLLTAFDSAAEGRQRLRWR